MILKKRLLLSKMNKEMGRYFPTHTESIGHVFENIGLVGQITRM